MDELDIEEEGWLDLVRQRKNKAVQATYKITHDIFKHRPKPGDRPDYNILAHRDEYAIVWGCVNVKPSVVGGKRTNLQTLVILTRNEFPDSKVRQNAINAVQGFHLDTSRLKKVDQTNCKE